MSSVVEIMLSFKEGICGVYFADSLNYVVVIDRGKLRKTGIATSAYAYVTCGLGA